MHPQSHPPLPHIFHRLEMDLKTTNKKYTKMPATLLSEVST
jgi:hypothetical protein